MALLGVAQQTVSRWEVGTSRPRTDELARIAAPLKIDILELSAAAGYAKRDAKRRVGDVMPVSPHASRFALWTLSRARVEAVAIAMFAGDQGRQRRGFADHAGGQVHVEAGPHASCTGVGRDGLDELRRLRFERVGCLQQQRAPLARAGPAPCLERFGRCIINRRYRLGLAGGECARGDAAAQRVARSKVACSTEAPRPLMRMARSDIVFPSADPSAGV